MRSSRRSVASIPFFLSLIARTRRPFTWRGLTFPLGRQAILDLYSTNHDPATWGDAEVFRPEQWSGEAHFFIAARKPGDFVEFTLTEQFQPRTLRLRITTSYDFGVATVSVNGQAAAERLDLFSEKPAVREVHLGTHKPRDNQFVIRCELIEPGPRSRGARTYLGLDSILIGESPPK